ncbi:MAG: D-Ala-D-Ala carboxypeptidase family metallohydrolase [Geminicoccaceae bacterium]
MIRLQDLLVGRVTILSGYRSPAYNSQVTSSASMTGAHTRGRAGDIYVAARERAVPKLLSLAKNHGMTRCGLQLSQVNFRRHFDDMTAGDGFAVRDDGELYCWTY